MRLPLQTLMHVTSLSRTPEGNSEGQPADIYRLHLASQTPKMNTKRSPVVRNLYYCLLRVPVHLLYVSNRIEEQVHLYKDDGLKTACKYVCHSDGLLASA